MKNIILALSLLWPLVSAFSQETLGSYERIIDNKKFKFILAGDPIERLIDQINIYCQDQTIACQVLKHTGEPLPERKENNFNFIDFNFDGHEDIALIAWYGNIANVRYNIWLFDPNTSRFLYNEELSQIVAPTPDPKHELINSYTKGDHFGCEKDESAYAFRDGKLLIQGQREFLFDEESCKFVIIERVRQGENIIELSRKENEACQENSKNISCQKL